MAELFPVFDVPDEPEDEEEEQQYTAAPMWDYEKGDFVTDGAGKYLYGSGRDAWILWCTKAMLTQRWAHQAYSDEFGTELEESFAEPDREAIESALERTITEALLEDPSGRTEIIRDFVFTWEADSVWVECEIVSTDGDTASIKAKLNE